MSLGWSVTQHGAPNSKYTQSLWPVSSLTETQNWKKSNKIEQTKLVKLFLHDPILNVDMVYWMFLWSESGMVSGFLFLFFFLFSFFSLQKKVTSNQEEDELQG